jgi:putative ABC transport system permease protein
MSIFKVAWRNIWRNRRRTIVTTSAMTLALVVMILYSGLVKGWLEGMRRDILDYEVGDIQIFAEGYRDNPSLYKRIDDPGRLIEALGKAGYPASARLLGAGLVAAGDSSAGVMFRGVDVKQDAAVSRIGTRIESGKWLDPKDPRGIVIGKKLVRMLDVKPGDEVVVLTQAADGSMADDLFRVRGVLRNLSEAVDRGGVFMTEGAFRDLFLLPGGAHQVLVRKPPAVTEAAALARVEKLAPGFDVKTWRQLMPTLSSMLDSAESVINVMFMLVYIVIGILILNAMLMAVFERIREFGVLKALGMGPLAVFRLVFTESLLQTAISTAAGLVLSLPGIWYLSTMGIDLSRLGAISVQGMVMDPHWRAEFVPAAFVGPVVVLIIIVSIAVIYPAVKAARLRPVEAITLK